MNGLILYYSRTNKTRYVAEIIKESLDKFELFELLEKNFSLRYGLLGYVKSGFDSVFNKKTELVKQPDFSKYDIIIFCSPVWAGKPAVPVRQVIEDNSLILQNKIKFIVTTSGGKSPGTYKFIEKLIGKSEYNLNFSSLSNEKLRIKQKITPEIQDLIQKISVKL
ncbi:hypothetical protein KA977_06345 [Candidatus Dependentiae bacterium]|nr:hypothetical protein [Candidatus Dependentiae bacterium]